MRRIRWYLAQEPADRRLIRRSYLWLLVVGVALRAPLLRSLIRRDLTEVVEPTGILPAGVVRARRYAYWLEVVSRHHVVRARCLHRSLVLHRWLRREGWPSSLQIGVRKEDGTLRAHAWVELGGEVINDAPAAVAAFTRLLRPGERMEWPGETRPRGGQRLGFDWTGVYRHGHD